METRLNLGQLIKLLETRPKDQTVMFDFGGLVPTKCASYRGCDEDLAIGFNDTSWPKVEDLLKVLKGTINQVFDGYDGGEYLASRESRVWVSNDTHTSGTYITGVEDCDYKTVLKTTWED